MGFLPQVFQAQWQEEVGCPPKIFGYLFLAQDKPFGYFHVKQLKQSKQGDDDSTS